jgi:ERCC4-type nuclease
MMELEIIIDTREQTPWIFPEFVNVRRGTLGTGDYAVPGDTWAIERKSLDDFLGSISSGWERFGREIDRMNGWKSKVIIVEGDFDQCCFRESGDGTILPPNHNHPQLTPAFVCSRIAELSLDGVSVLFAGSADLAAGLAYQILKKRNLEVRNAEIGGNR